MHWAGNFEKQTNKQNNNGNNCNMSDQIYARQWLNQKRTKTTRFSFVYGLWKTSYRNPSVQFQFRFQRLLKVSKRFESSL